MWFNFINTFYLTTELIFFFLINLFIVIYLVEKIILKKKEMDPFYIFLIILVVLICLFIIINNSIEMEPTLAITYFFNNYFIYNKFIRALKIFMFIVFISYCIIVYNFKDFIKLFIFEYMLLNLIAFWGLSIILISNNLFIIFLFLELVNLSIYCMLGLNKNSNWSVEIAFKYFIQSSLIMLIGLLGLSLIYISAGTLFINDLSALNKSGSLTVFSIIGLYLIILSLTFKFGLYPMHSWLPEVYQGSLLITTIFIALVPKIIYLYVFFETLIEFEILLQNFIYFTAIITIVYGAIVTSYQTSLKRFLAYGSMIHYGFILLILSYGNLLNAGVAFFYLFTYSSLIAFIPVLILYMYNKNDEDYIYFLDDISNLYILEQKDKILAFLLAFTLCALAGLPLFAGFVSKWYMLYSLIMTGAYTELFIIFLTSVISAAYYIRLIRFMFFTSAKINEVEYFSNIKYNKNFYYLLIIIFVMNIIIILLHESIFLLLLKLLIGAFV